MALCGDDGVLTCLQLRLPAPLAWAAAVVRGCPERVNSSRTNICDGDRRQETGSEAVSVIASGLTNTPLAGPAEVVDVIVTGAAVISTELQYSSGQLSGERRWALHLIAVPGMIPGPWGYWFLGDQCVVHFFRPASIADR
jgi:hypothetical protein